MARGPPASASAALLYSLPSALSQKPPTMTIPWRSASSAHSVTVAPSAASAQARASSLLAKT